MLVAHNARFDIGFLDAALVRATGRRLACPVLDTVPLARRLLAGRLRRFSLARLADHLGTTVEPCHRALPDARATAEVLLALLGRAQERGARTVDDLLALGAPPATRGLARRHLAADAPSGPGTYRMEDAAGGVLYVGSAGDSAGACAATSPGPPTRERPIDRALPAVHRIAFSRTGSGSRRASRRRRSRRCSRPRTAATPGPAAPRTRCSTATRRGCA